MVTHLAWVSQVVVGLVRRTWLVAVMTVAVCAMFAAKAAAAFVEARHLDPLPQTSPLPRQVSVAPVVTPVRDGNALVERNMFCSSCTPPAPSSGPGPTSSFVPEAVLIATTIGTLPIATVRVPVSEVQGDFGVGDALPGVGTITRIGFSTIDITDSAGRIGTLSLRSTTTDPGGRSDTGAATPEPAAAAHPYADRIKKIDDTTFEADRELVRELMTSNGKNAGARILPVNKGGKLDGLRLIGVQPNKLASSLGLANGDVLQAINNTKIENANTLLEMYAQLDKLDTVTFDGVRRGKPLTLTLRLR